MGSAFVGGLSVLALAGMNIVGGARPKDLGLSEGKLRPCPNGSRNCVASETPEPARRVASIRLSVDPARALERIAEVIAEMPRAKVVTQNDAYLHAEFTSLVFRFVDDLELRLDRDTKSVHVRSASRVGKGDLGVNRRRVEELEQRLRAAGIAQAN
jgi:uncharacterized protein (DUF1499 family)